MESYGVLSTVPAVLSIILAIYTRNIIFSLTIGTFSGTLIHTGFNPFFAVVELMEDHVFVQVSSGSNSQVIVVMLIIGGFIALLEKSGGTGAFSTVMVRFISNPVRAQMAAWTTGLSVFFTDSGNALIVGPLFRPVFKKLKICPEKLAYIIDTTASPVIILIPFAGWGVYIMSLIENSYADIGLVGKPYDVLLSVWPYQFYAFLALLSIPMILSTGRDLGPMARAQFSYNTALKEGTLEENEGDEEDKEVIQERPRLITVILPLSVMLISMVMFLSYFAYTEGVKSVHVRSGIALAYLFASFSCAYLMKRYKRVSYNETLNHFVKGMEKLVFICFVLVLAWSLSSICNELHTGDYLATLIGDLIDPDFFPVIVFLLGAVMSFATGSSYGTFAILMIIVVPVAHTLGAPLHLTIAAVLSGGLFGDHTSPISDTTVLASMGAGCPHLNHVTTQLVYALFIGFMTVMCFVAAAIFQSPMVVLFMVVIQFVIIHLMMRLYGRNSIGE